MMITSRSNSGVAKITAGLAILLLGAAAHSQQRLEVKIDPRIELMAVTEVLADYGWTGLLSKQDTAYRRDVDAWFAPFKQHAAVKRFAELAKAGYSFDGPAGTMICLSAPPELKLEGRLEECGAERAGGSASLEAWLEQLRDFARVSDFGSFFRAHAGLYSLMEEATRKQRLEPDILSLDNAASSDFLREQGRPCRAVSRLGYPPGRERVASEPH